MTIKRNLDYDNKKVCYFVRGTGAPVLFIHGFGEKSAVWFEIAEKLSKIFKVIMPDIPGSGESDFNPSLSTIEDYAKVIHGIIQIEVSSKEKISIIGHSMGGYIALSFYKLFPEAVLKLGLFHSSVFADDEEKITVRKKAIEFINKNGASAFLKTSIPNLFSEKSRNDNNDGIGMLLSDVHSFSSNALIQYYYAMIQRADMTELIKKTEIPFLFIIGHEDKAVPLNISLKQCHLALISCIKILKNVAHMGMYENNRESVNTIRSFLTDRYY